MPGLIVPAIKVVMSGRINGVQSWSTGFWVDQTQITPGMNQAELDAFCVAMEGFAVTWWVAVSGAANAGTDLRQVTCYYYSPGAVVASLVAVVPLAPSLNGTGVIPNIVQASIVHSLRTASAGRSGRGRMYMPATGLPLNSVNAWTLAQCTTQANGTVAFFHSVNAFASAPSNTTSATVIVASFTHGSTAPVNRVIVDSDPDVQRRRSDKVIAAFQASVVL